MKKGNFQRHRDLKSDSGPASKKGSKDYSQGQSGMNTQDRLGLPYGSMQSARVGSKGGIQSPGKSQKSARSKKKKSTKSVEYGSAASSLVTSEEDPEGVMSGSKSRAASAKSNKLPGIAPPYTLNDNEQLHY